MSVSPVVWGNCWSCGDLVLTITWRIDGSSPTCPHCSLQDVIMLSLMVQILSPTKLGHLATSWLNFEPWNIWSRMVSKKQKQSSANMFYIDFPLRVDLNFGLSIYIFRVAIIVYIIMYIYICIYIDMCNIYIYVCIYIDMCNIYIYVYVHIICI